MAKYAVAVKHTDSPDHITETIRGKRNAGRRASELRARIVDLDALTVTVDKI